MGRKDRSGMSGGSYTQYDTAGKSMKGLGLDNGGETDRWMGSLSPEETQAVSDYTGSAYEELNDALRRERDFDDDGNFDYPELDRQLEKAIDKFNLERNTTFTRGSSAALLGGAGTVEEINAMKGSIVHDRAYTSSSAHTGGGFDGEVIYHIKTPKGKGIGAYVRGLSHFKNEDEFLFNKGSAFKVLNAYEDSWGQVHCNLRYMGRF